MFYLFICLKTILKIVLFSSCVADRLVVHSNDNPLPLALCSEDSKQSLTPLSKKSKWAEIAERYTDIMLSLCPENKRDTQSAIEYISKRFVMNKDGAPRIIVELPYISMHEKTVRFITPVVRLTDFPEDIRDNILYLVRSTALINFISLVGSEALFTYMRDNCTVDTDDFVQEMFKKANEIVCNAQTHYKNGEMFGDVIYKALDLTTKYSTHLLRKNLKGKAIQKIQGDNFFKKQGMIYEKVLSGCSDHIKAMQIAYRVYPEAELAIAYISHIYKKEFNELDIIRKVIHLCRCQGENVAAKFYADVASIFETTAMTNEARKKVDEAFEKAVSTPAKNIDELLEFIEDKRSKKGIQRTKTKQEDKGQTSHGEKCVPLALDQNKEEPKEEEIILSEEELGKLFNEEFRFHPRVVRWLKEPTIYKIRKFDVNDRSGKIRYADRSEEYIKKQRDFHNLQPAAWMLCVPGADKCFFKTSKGKSAFATMEIGGTTYEGMLEIGIYGKKRPVIYHLMFNDKVKHRPDQLFQITNPLFEDSFKDSLDHDTNASQECNKKSLKVAMQGSTYAIELDSDKSIYIHDNKLSITNMLIKSRKKN